MPHRCKDREVEKEAYFVIGFIRSWAWCNLLEEALTRSSRLSDIAIYSRHHGPILNNGCFTATDLFYSDRMLAIRGVPAGLYS